MKRFHACSFAVIKWLERAIKVEEKNQRMSFFVLCVCHYVVLSRTESKNHLSIIKPLWYEMAIVNKLRASTLKSVSIRAR